MGRATWKHTNVARFSSEIRSVTALPGPSTSHCKERPVGSDTKPCRAVNFSELVHAGTHFTCYVSLLRCAVLGGGGRGGEATLNEQKPPSTTQNHNSERGALNSCPSAPQQHSRNERATNNVGSGTKAQGTASISPLFGVSLIYVTGSRNLETPTKNKQTPTKT